MRFYANASGAVIRILRTEADEQNIGAPTEYAEELAVDERTNEHIALLVRNDSEAAFNLNGGVLTWRGNTISVNPPSRVFEDREYLREFGARMDTAIPWFEAEYASWSSLDNAGKQSWLLAHADELMLAHREVLTFLRWYLEEKLSYRLDP
ncbi:MAG: hypothetical protein JXC32_20675 [Anaerolineae bacterium]|nr:hypothetical protein [Anaerolineae bacterium]